jgi:hypothetical protein
LAIIFRTMQAVTGSFRKRRVVASASDEDGLVLRPVFMPGSAFADDGAWVKA